MKIKVYKFGGASVKDAGAVQNLAAIIRHKADENLVVIVSAMGKTTNALEQVVQEKFRGEKQIRDSMRAVEDYHRKIIFDLLGDKEGSPLFNLYFQQFTEYVASRFEASFDALYDELVSFGEMFSTAIVCDYLKQNGLPITFLDARNLIKTDSLHRDARVQWESTERLIKSAVEAAFSEAEFVISQGFIASDQAGHTTTLGREGSDFTGAVFAYSLNAESLTIWKDVEGLLNADPKFFKETKKIDKISYGETIELAFYGATIIHPKTIKPLQNKSIPLYVRSFVNPKGEGTLVQYDGKSDHDIPSYIFKSGQILLTLSPRDYSFMDVENLATIFRALAEHHIKINVMQNSALSLSLCVDKRNSRVEHFIQDIRSQFQVKYNEGLTLMTIRHYTEDIIRQMSRGKRVLLEQRSRSTVQLVLAP